jgi:hypothetical protein
MLGAIAPLPLMSSWKSAKLINHGDNVAFLPLPSRGSDAAEIPCFECDYDLHEIGRTPQFQNFSRNLIYQVTAAIVYNSSDLCPQLLMTFMAI